MVCRADKSQKFKRWLCYRPMDSRPAAWKNTLKNVVGKGRVNIRFLEMSRRRAQLEWPIVVTSCSAKRLVKLATDADPDFKLSGEPLGLAEDEVCASPHASAGEQSRPELAAENVDQPSLDETRLYQPSLDQPQPESRRGLAPRLLLVKSACISGALKNAAAYAERPPKYKVHLGARIGPRLLWQGLCWIRGGPLG